MDVSKRGRPIGSSPTKHADDVILRRAAHRIFFFGDITPRKIFVEALRDEEKAKRLHPDQHDAVLRRLQRRWQRDSAHFLTECEEQQAGFWVQRRELEAKTLKAEAPELFARVEKFGASPSGKEIIAAYGVPGRPGHLLSLGLAEVWELIQ